MRLGGRWCARFVAIVLLGVNVAASREAKSATEITVLVNNSAGVSAEILTQAKAEASRIFRTAGVEIDWVDCPRAADIVEGDACRRVPGPSDFVLHIVAKGKTSSDLVFGLSFLGEDGAGKYSDLFYDRVQQAHRELGADVASLLGSVAAHELGHLLLGLHAHSYVGIMAAVWNEDALRNMGMGGLRFNRDQAAGIRARIQAGEGTVARVSVRVGRNMPRADL